ncbi:MAG: complex I subunit 4 family protein [Solitalea-like symbiont of Acarus siro]
MFTSLSSNYQYFFNFLVCGLMFVGFAVKIPIFPLHLWLPQAHTCASTPISIILAGISLKVGFYGLFRFVYGLFPALSLQFSQFIVYWSLFTIIYAGLNAFKSKDLKEMVAWSSISHMGFAMVGLASLTIEGINGAILQLLSHGLLAIALFLIPHFIYVRVNDRLIYNFTGLYNIMPKYISVSTLIFFVSMGLPGFSPFIAELLILLSLIKMFLLNNINILIAVPFLLALFIGVLYWLKIIKGMFLGQLLLKDNSYNKRLCDISVKESSTVIIVMLVVLLLGLYPNLIFNRTDQPAEACIKYIYKVK